MPHDRLDPPEGTEKFDQAIARLASDLLISRPPAEISRLVLEHALSLTGSSSGLVGCLEPRASELTGAAGAGEPWARVKDSEAGIPLETLPAPWRTALREKEPGIGNEPGHRFLCAIYPLDRDATGMIAVSGADQNYQDREIELVRRLTALHAVATERRRAEERMQAANRELSRANAQLEQFAQMAAHDLHEPVRMTRLFLQMIERRHRDSFNPDAAEYFTFAAEGANRAKAILDDLRAQSSLSRWGAAFLPADAGVALEEALAKLRPAIEETGAVVTHGALPRLKADPGRLAELFQRLLDNAIKFRNQEPPRVHVSAERIRQAWILSVRDNGRGIARDRQQQLFETFPLGAQPCGDASAEHGLALARRIVEHYGGRIWVESHPGAGTTVRFTVPDRMHGTGSSPGE